MNRFTERYHKMGSKASWRKVRIVTCLKEDWRHVCPDGIKKIHVATRWFERTIDRIENDAYQPSACLASKPGTYGPSM